MSAECPALRGRRCTGQARRHADQAVVQGLASEDGLASKRHAAGEKIGGRRDLARGNPRDERNGAL